MEAGDSTPKSVKLQINADSAVSQNYTTCVGGVILHNPSHPDAFLHLDNGGTKFEYLDDELPENGRVFRAQPTEHREEGEESVTMTLIRRGNVDQEMKSLVWADPYPSVRWSYYSLYRGLGYRASSPENWRSGVATKDYEDIGRQVSTWEPGEVQAKAVELKLIDNKTNDSSKVIYWNYTAPNNSMTSIYDAFIFVADIEDMFWGALDSDSDQFNNSVDADMDGDGIYNWLDYDKDGDGVSDFYDAFRFDPSKSQDMDFDGIADADDSDTDGDGIADNLDPFPYINEFFDNDGDGVLNVDDLDDDNDQVLDFVDAFPFDETETIDTDGDGIGENTDDDDGDGIANANDAFAGVDIGDLVDLDGDGAPGVCDELCLSNGMLKDNDDDGDGWSDKLETEYGADPTSPNSVLSFLQRGSDIDGENAGDLSGIVSINGDGSVVAIGATGNDFMAQDAGQVRVLRT